jgi:peptidyl-prolyl cis-trans isomerase SurA
MHRLVVAAALVASIMTFGPTARAQGSVATVNGEPITETDVQQRMRISSLVYRRPLSRAAALNELIDERVKMQEARRIGLRPTPAFLDDALGRMASSNRQQPAQFEQNLQKAGIQPDALKAKIGADAVWSELLRTRSRNNNMSNAELNAEVDRRVARGEANVTDYVVRQIVFVVPQGVSPGARERDANASRGRFADCETGVEYMRTLRDVAVRERISRTSTDLSKQLNDMLQKTPVGRLTAPFRSEQGVEMLAVCEKNTRQDTLGLRNRVEQELMSRRSETSAGPYLNELRSKAQIQR